MGGAGALDLALSALTEPTPRTGTAGSRAEDWGARRGGVGAIDPGSSARPELEPQTGALSGPGARGATKDPARSGGGGLASMRRSRGDDPGGGSSGRTPSTAASRISAPAAGERRGESRASGACAEAGGSSSVGRGLANPRPGTIFAGAGSPVCPICVSARPASFAERAATDRRGGCSSRPAAAAVADDSSRQLSSESPLPAAASKRDGSRGSTSTAAPTAFAAIRDRKSAPVEVIAPPNRGRSAGAAGSAPKSRPRANRRRGRGCRYRQASAGPRRGFRA